MKSRLLIGALVLASATAGWGQLMASHSTPKPGTPAVPLQDLASPVARVNGQVLTARDLLREEYIIFPYARQHNGQIPQSMAAGIHDGAMQMIIFEELAYQEALRRRMAVPALKLAKAEKDFRSRFNSTGDYQQFVQVEFGGSQPALREKIRRSLLIDAFLKTEINSKSVVTPAELKAYYDKNPAKFQYPEGFLIQTISFIPPEKATPQQLQEARKKAEAALPQAQAAKTAEVFGLLAEKVSEDDYRVMMGRHKPMERAELAPPVLQKLLTMKEGQVTGVIQIGQIYTIVRLNKHILPGKRKFAAVKEDLMQEMQSEKTNKVRAALGKKLRGNAKIEIL
jgi:peptidyl-prolyl cis-trans isomerase SurA